VSPSSQRLVFKNTAWLVIGQALAAPLSVLVNAVIGRELGPSDLGYIYLASTLAGFGFLLVDFGQSTALPALIAQQRDRASELLGASLTWKSIAALIVCIVLTLGSLAFGHERKQQIAIALVVISFGFGALAGAVQDAIRGFERTDLAAAGQVGAQLLIALTVVPVLLLGGGLTGALTAQVAASAVGLFGAGAFAWHVGIRTLLPTRAALKNLLAAGSPFLLLGGALAMQPAVDALFLARLTPPEVIGWHAVARRLSGVLMIPAASLITSLYPTLSRLWQDDRDDYFRLGKSALRTTCALAVPLLLCCFLYPDVGTRIFGREGFAPAEQNLRVLSGAVFLTWFSMTLGCCLSAAGRQREWAACQLGCVAVSALLDPLLIPIFQSQNGNGGVGVCAGTVISEVGMSLAAASWLAPKGLLDAGVAKQLARSLAAGAGMLAAARLCSNFTPFVGAPLALLAYLALLWLLGGVEREQVLAVRGALLRRWKGLFGT
jgi:O-antigen/teichoic acid export membrane protein